MRRKRPTRRQQRFVAQAVVGGLGLTLAPFFVRTEPLQTALSKLQPVGLLMFVIGLGLAWYQSKQQQDGTSRQRTQAPPGAKVVRFQSVERKQPKSAAEIAVRNEPPHVPAQPSGIDQWSPDVFRAIEWRRFEAVVEALFAQAGFQTKSQSHGADGGVDVWLYSKNDPGKPVSIVQCKHWQGSKVGVDKVRELRGVMAAHDVRRGQFATTSTFTADAESFAKANGVNLLDVSRLLDLIAKRTPEQQAELLAVATEGDYWRPTCVNCGIKLTERKRRDGGLFWGCTNYPRCKTTMALRA